MVEHAATGSRGFLGEPLTDRGFSDSVEIYYF